MEKCGREYLKPTVSIYDIYLNTDNQCQFTVTVDFHSKPLLIDPEIFKAPLKFYRLTPDDELLEKKQVYNIQYILLN